MRDLEKALSEISAIRGQIARGTEFQGYGPATLAATGVLALAAAVAQSAWLPDPAAAMTAYLALWAATAALSCPATALRATRPAAISTLGFEVLVHDVIAAMTTSPCPRSKSRPSTLNLLPSSPGFLYSPASAVPKPALTSGSEIRPSGRFGPAIEGTTVPRSSDSVSVNIGSAAAEVRNSPCALA